MDLISRDTHKPFTISAKEEAFCRDNHIPLPATTHYERLRDLLYFYNCTFLYNGTCALTGKPMLSTVPPDTGFKVYDISVWMDDTAWDPLQYGRDFDFSRPFFEQFEELMREAPIPSRSVVLSSMENSDYCNGVSQVKNCYLTFNCDSGEDSYFCYQMQRVKNIIDSIDIQDSELCYNCKHIKHSYQLLFSENCENCSHSAFLFNCRNVKNSFGCTNLVNKEYCWYNEQKTESEFKKLRSELNLGNHHILEEERKKFTLFKQQAYLKEFNGIFNENSTGNFINQCKNCISTFFSTQAEDCEYSLQANKGKDCYVYTTFGFNVELVYNSAVCGHNVYNVKFCLGCFVNIRDLEYCMHVGFGSQNCFGSIGLRKKEYCILNKQYSKEEYFSLIEKIKDHMRKNGEYGQFFPLSFSPFHYNKSEANFFFPLTQAEATQSGFSWEDDIVEPFESNYIIADDIKDVPDSITEQVLKCSVSGKKYRIIKQELALYRQWQVPIPHIAPLERIKLSCETLALPEIKSRHCSNCQKEMRTPFADAKTPVYCEACYQNANQ